MALAQNGYSVIFDASRLKTYRIGDSRRTLDLRNDASGALIADFCGWYDANIEPIDGGIYDDWAHAVRKIVGSAWEYSNHSAANAVDLNATQHPLGLRWTFKAWQYAKLRWALRFRYRGCIRHGIDYHDRPDEMHAEIVAGLEKCAAALRRVRRREIRKRRAKLPKLYYGNLLVAVKQGQRNNRNVRLLQRALRSEGYKGIEVTGRWRPDDAEALKQFERKELKRPHPDGEPGPASVRALGRNRYRIRGLK